MPVSLRMVRGALRRLNTYLSRRYESSVAQSAPMPQAATPQELEAAREQLQRLDLPDRDARNYFAKHLPRLARTLCLTPQPKSSSRILELGCYMQLTPFLARGADTGKCAADTTEFWAKAVADCASVSGETFECTIDLFDAERDPFPYPDGHFETVLGCEMIEHFLRDPMHCLLESRRVLEEGGRLMITTPNVSSLTSVARASARIRQSAAVLALSDSAQRRSHGSSARPRVHRV